MILQDLSVPALARANEENLRETFGSFGRLPQVDVLDERGIFRFATGIPHPTFNGVLRSRLAPADADSRIEETLGFFRARGLPITWWLGPSSKPADLAARLEAHGLVHVFDSPGMAIDLRTIGETFPSPQGLVLSEVASPEMLREWMGPFAEGFEVSPAAAEGIFHLLADLGLGPEGRIRYYLGRLRGEPVATSALFLGTAVAGIYAVATSPHARRIGIGASLTLEALHAARSLGYRVAILQSSPVGVGVYSKLGFFECCQFAHYERPEGGQPRVAMR